MLFPYLLYALSLLTALVAANDEYVSSGVSSVYPLCAHRYYDTALEPIRNVLWRPDKRRNSAQDATVNRTAVANVVNDTPKRPTVRFVRVYYYGTTNLTQQFHHRQCNLVVNSESANDANASQRRRRQLPDEKNVIWQENAAHIYFRHIAVVTPIDVHLFGRHVRIDAIWTCACTNTDGCEEIEKRALICNSIFDRRILPCIDYLYARTEPYFYNITDIRFVHARCSNSISEVDEQRMPALSVKPSSLPSVTLILLVIFSMK